jgi:HEAT repeat protein
MWHFRQLGTFRSSGLVLLVLGGVLAGPLPARTQERPGTGGYVPTSGSEHRRPGDPVDLLQQALKVSITDADRNPEVVNYRRRTLQKRVEALRTVGELRQALLLTDWRDDDVREEKIAEVDKGFREEIVRRLQQQLRDAFQRGSRADKLAALALLADMGISDQKPTRPGTARSLAPDIVDLIRRERDPEVRAAAARALGKINPDLRRDSGKGDVMGALTDLLQTGTVIERRAAATGLLDLVQVMLGLARQTQTGAQASRGDLLLAAVAVVPAAGRGLDVPDARVRATSIQAIQAAASAVGELMDKGRDPQEFPPPGRPLNTREREEIQLYAKMVAEEREQLRPLMVALGAQAPHVAARANDPDAGVRLDACHAVEEIGFAYRRLLRKAESVPKLDGPAPKEKKPEKKPEKSGAAFRRDVALATVLVADVAAERRDPDPILDGLERALPALEAGMRDPDVRARRAAIDAVELLGERAAPAVPALRRALSDPDRFVRWAAARTLGRVGVEHAAVAVPDLARLSADPDLDVRQVAMTVLERFGPAARAAVPDLTRAAAGGEGTVRVVAMHALEAIGPEARSAIPTLTAALDARDARVLIAASHALASFGAASRQAVPSLEKLLNDPDSNVRQAASDAILAIAPPK